VALSKGEGVKTDIYGMGEKWWRERVNPWKENHEALNADYGNEKDKFMLRGAP